MNRITKIAVILLSLCLLTSCATLGQVDIMEKQNNGASENSVYIVQSEALYPLPTGCRVEGVARQGQTLLLTGRQNGAGVVALTEYEADENGAICLGAVRTPEAAEPYYYAVCAGGDGAFYLLAGEVPTENEPTREYRLLRLDTEGRLHDSFAFCFEPKGSSSLCHLAVTADGLVVTASAEDLLVLDRSREEQRNIQQEGLVYHSLQSCELGVLAGCLNGAEGGFQARRIEADGNSTPLVGLTDSLSDAQSLDGRYLVNDGHQFYLCSADNEPQSEPLRWNLDDRMAGTGNCCQLTENAFAFTLSDDALHVIRSKEGKAEAQTVVKVAISASLPAHVYSMIYEMNASGSGYTYEIVTIDADDLTRLKTGLIVNDSPDLIIFDGSYIGAISTDSRAFADLYPLLDADPELGREDILQNLLQALENQGELHELWAGMSITALAARAADLNSRQDLRMADYQHIVDADERYRGVFESFMTKDNILKWIAMFAAGEYVDREKAICHFDDPAFAELLTWAKENAPDYKGEANPDGWNVDEAVLWVSGVGLFSSPKQTEEILKAPFIFVGFPSDHGSGTFFKCNWGFTIPSGSCNKEGAWAFIREQMKMGRQIAAYPTEGLPTNAEAFERLAVRELTDENGVLNETYFLAVMDLMEKTTKAYNATDQQLSEIIYNTGMAYMNGDKTLEETVKIIQSRCNIYIAEKYN